MAVHYRRYHIGEPDFAKGGAAPAQGGVLPAPARILFFLVMFLISGALTAAHIGFPPTSE